MQNTDLAQQVLEKLAQFDLQREPGGEYRSNSPLRSGANSHSFHLKLDDEGGTYYDHVSEERGTLYELATLLGLRITQQGQVEDSLRAYRSLDEYAELHGVNADYLRKNGWSDVVQYQGRPALRFKTATGDRWRFIDGNNPKYKSVWEYKSTWYGSVNALAAAKKGLNVLVLCNGEISTLVGQSYGVPALCFTGGSERGIPLDLLPQAEAWSKMFQILIVLDCDRKGREAAPKIKAQLPSAVVIELGLGEKGDLADFCKLHQYDSLRQLLSLQSQSPMQQTAQVEVGMDTSSLAAALTQLAQLRRLDEQERKRTDVAMLLAQAKAEIERIEAQTSKATIVSFADLARENRAALEWAMAHPDPIQGLRTGIPSLDKGIGGLLPEFYDVYGATGMGKSWACVTLAKSLITQAAGIIVTTESKPNRWLTRLTACITGIAADRIETGMVSADEARRINDTYDMLEALHCHIVKDSRPSPAQVRSAVLKGLEQYDYKWVIVDSASNMVFPGATDIYSITSGVADGLQQLYLDTNLPVIATSQVKREVSERKNKMPQLADGYGSGKIEHNAGVLLALYRHGYYVEKGMDTPHPKFPNDMTLVNILKNRWRPTTNINSVCLTFLGGGGFGERRWADWGNGDEPPKDENLVELLGAER